MPPHDKPLTLTLDLEDHRPDESFPKRYPEITRRILAFMDERQIKGTVFVLGSLAREEPALIKEIATRGHEIGYHTFEHVHLTREDPARFRTQAAADKAMLEDLCGERVLGFRAPAFSMTREDIVGIGDIERSGFRIFVEYATGEKSGLRVPPGAPARPFRWPNGILEIPAPIARFGPLSFPFLGGIYLRYFPPFVITYLLRRNSSEQSYWAYCHPHDFDHEERFFRIRGTSTLVSVLLWFNRRRTFEKLGKLFPAGADERCGATFAAQLRSGSFDDAPVFDV